MSVYTRFKRDPDGFRKLVELLEATPISKREKMISVGMQEDAAYTEKALDHVILFTDIVELSDLELAEVVAETPGAILGRAISQSSPETQTRFLKNAKGPKINQIRDAIDEKPSLATVGGAQLKVVEFTRSLERKGLLKLKKIS